MQPKWLHLEIKADLDPVRALFRLDLIEVGDVLQPVFQRLKWIRESRCSCGCCGPGEGACAHSRVSSVRTGHARPFGASNSCWSRSVCSPRRPAHTRQPSPCASICTGSSPTDLMRQPLYVPQSMGVLDLLAEQGIQVARRTIAKYRESLNIPPSNERKTI